MTGKPPAQAVSDDELIEAVRQVCEKRGLPVAPTRLIEEVDGIDIQQQTIKRRLDKISHRVNSLKVGRGKVWWVPDGEEVEGEVDVSAINWAQIEPEEIPPQKIEDHPEFNIPDYWESWTERANTVVTIAFPPTFVGFIVFALQDANIPVVGGIGRDAATLGALVTLAGLFFIVIGILIGIAAKAGAFLAAHGVDEQVQTARSKIVGTIKDRIPLSVSWKS